MKIVNFSVHRPVAISMLVIAMVILGLISVPKLGVNFFPEMDLPVAVVSTSYQGADPAEIEATITKILESAVGTVGNLAEISSVSQAGSSLIILEFDWGTDMDNALVDVRERVAMFQEMLPDDAGSPRIMQFDPNSFPIMIYTLSGEDLLRLNDLAEEQVQTALERIDGVASVSLAGGWQREFQVLPDRSKMKLHNITTSQLIQTIRADNISGTAGAVQKGGHQLAIRVQAEYHSIADLAAIQIPLRGGASNIRLADIAEIRDDFKEITAYSYVDGQPALSIQIFRASGHNTVQVAREVRTVVTRLSQELPDRVLLTEIMDSAKFVEHAINNLVGQVLIGGMLALVILYFFLRSIRGVIVVAIAMPVAVIFTFTMMYFGNQTLNMLSLAGLALGLGALVDFSVVVLENIYRYRQNGYSMKEAAKRGTAEVGGAVLAAGTTQVVVFAPIVFVAGLAAILFTPLAFTVCVSQMAALFVALTLVPMLASRLLKNVAATDLTALPAKTKNPVLLFEKAFERLRRCYAKILRWALRHRKTVVTLAVVLFVGSIALVPFVGTEFTPPMDEGEIIIDIEMSAGTILAETKLLAGELAVAVKKELPDYCLIFSQIGVATDMPGQGIISSNTATLHVKLAPQAERDYTTAEAVEQIRYLGQGVPGALINIRAGEGGGPGGGSAVELIIKGDDLAVLKQLATMVAGMLENVAGTRNVASTLDETSLQVQVQVDREQAARYSLAATQIISAVQVAFDGQIVSKVRTGDDEVDVRLMYSDEFKTTHCQLTNLIIVTPAGGQVALNTVADIAVKAVPVKIERSNQEREVRVTAGIFGRDTGSVNADIQARLAQLAIPAGYTIETGGDAADMAEAFTELALAMLLAILLVYMVMAAQFESLINPFVIMFAIPPTFTGVVLGLLASGQKISVMAAIGAIMLVGIVVNNAIVLVDYINTLRRSGLKCREAVLQAGPIRLRPIMITAMTTVLALMPLIFATGEGSESWKPMAVVVASGLTFSTLITLVLVPVVYTIFDDWGLYLKKRLKMLLSKSVLLKMGLII